MEKENWFVSKLNEENKQNIKVEVLERCQKWIDGYIDNFKEDYGEDSNYRRSLDLLEKDAIDNAKLELESNFNQIQEDCELISVDQEDEPEQYEFEKSIINQWIENL